MADEIVKIIRIQTEGSEKTVGGLRDEIKSLRDALLNLDKGTKEYEDTLNQIIKDEIELTQVMKAGKDEVAKSLKGVTSAYVSQKQELKALKVELEQLQPGTDAYNEKFARAAEITANLKRQQEMLKYSSNDLGDQLSNIRGIGANMAAGFSAVNAAMGLFGTQNEDVAKAMLKVQQAMALVQGLQGMDGFIKRTQGLSSALKGWITQSKTATVQTTAQATATKTAAAATNAETIATESATVAQKGLNAAMKANPIGIILTAITLLVANWKTLTNWIGKAVGGFDNFKKAINRVKQVVSGFANVIAKALLVPIREAINTVTTLGKVLYDVFTLNWDNIGKDIKNGITKSVDIVKDGYDVAGNYAVGNEKEITRQTAAELKKRASDRKAELDDVIADNEAKYGSDWKYTQDGEKAYKEYFDNLLAMYDKDSKEYKEAQRDKWSYEREVADKKDKTNKENQKSAVDAAKKAQDELKKIETDYQSKVGNTVGATYSATYKAFRENVNAYVDYFKNISKNMKPVDAGLKKWVNDFTNTYKNELDKNLNDTEVFVRETISLLNGLSKDEIKNVIGEDFFNRMFSGLSDGDISNKWKSMVSTIGDEGGLAIADALKMRMSVEATRMNKQVVSLLKDIMDNSSEEANKKINDNIIKLFQKTIIPNINDEVSRLQTEINKKVVKFDFEIETGLDFEEFQNAKYVGIDSKAKEFEKATAIYSNSLDKLDAELKYYQQTVDYVDKNCLIPSDAYNEAIKKIEEINIASAQTQLNFFNAQAEIRRKYFDKDLSEIESQTQKELREAEYKYNSLLTEQDIFSGVMPKREMELVEQLYQIQKHGIEEQLALYELQLSEQTLTAEERVSIEQTVADLTAQIEEGEVAHTIEMTQRKQDAFMTYFSMIQDGMGAIGDLFGGLADYYEADLEAQVKAGKMSEEQADKQFENIKKMRIAEAIINTLAGSIGAFLQASATYPPPFGSIIGAVSAAAVAAAGFAQVQQIKNQTRNSSSTGQSPIAVPSTPEYVPNYVENPTGNSEQEDLRNTIMSQPIYVRVSDIDAAQEGRRVRTDESSF